jgi:hypothetical protein
MTTSIARHDRGTSIGGQFRATAHREAGITLGAPAVGTQFVEDRLRSLDRFDYFSGDQTEEITWELNVSLDFSDRNILALADSIHLRDHGHTATDARNFGEAMTFLREAGRDDHAESLLRMMEPKTTRAAAIGTPLAPGPDGFTSPIPDYDPRVQAGEVFDQVRVLGNRPFHRRRDGVFPNEPYAMRFQANRELSDDEKIRFAGMVGYAYSAKVRGEGVGIPEIDSPFSFVVRADTTKSRRSDLGQALEEFEELLPTIVNEGSRIRTTNQEGPGTEGTRLVEGFNEPDLKFEIYYDSVVRP